VKEILETKGKFSQGRKFTWRKFVFEW